MTQFIAEISSNHAQDLERCLALIETAAEIGCGAVKFQLFEVDQLFAPEILAVSAAHRARIDWELPPHFIPELAAAAHANGIEFACTPFHLRAVEVLEPHVAFYKIASYELLWDGLLRACAETGKPVILSTGMATLAEVDHAVAVLRDAGCRSLALLHCVSAYPTPLEDANLAAIETMRRRYNIPVGWSDHTRDPLVVARAVMRWGAEIVELHLDLDEAGAEYSSGHCWLPREVAEVIADIDYAAQADGHGRKEPAPSELADRPWRADPVDGLRPLKEIRQPWVYSRLKDVS